MPVLLNIRSRIESLPELQKKKQNNAKVRAFTSRIENALTDLKECVEQRTCYLVVFPDAMLSKTVDAVKQSKLQASRLVEKLKEDFDAISSSDTDKKVTRIGERNVEAKTEIQTSWKRQIDDVLRPFVPLVDIVREAKLPGNQDILASMEWLRARAMSPPNTIELAKKIRNTLDALRHSLSELDLEGPGGEFLKRAVRGTAKPKDLLNDEVRHFLDEKDLWDILTIRVG